MINASEKIEFMVSLPPIQSAIQISGLDDSARLKFVLEEYHSSIDLLENQEI